MLPTTTTIASPALFSPDVMRGAAAPRRVPSLTGPLGRVVVVGTFPPTACGIATYTAHLGDALARDGDSIDVIRLVDDGSETSPAPVVFDWRRDRRDDTLLAASVANRYDAVLLQHEFGIFPGEDGDEVIRFLAECRRPVVTVLHTVLGEPTRSQQRVVDAVLRHSALVVVHTAIARVRLLATADVAPLDVVVVPYGASVDGGPGRPGPVPGELPSILTWGLLGPGKGIDVGISAVAEMRRAGFDVRYVVAGDVDPEVRRRDGEAYRDGLVALTHQLGVSDLVTFDAGYRGDAALAALVRAADLVLLPYHSTEQVASAVLVEAIAAGRPVVATAFPHAVELSATGAVHVVRHRAPDRCANAIHAILTDPRRYRAMQQAARNEGSRYDWSIVADRLRALVLDEIRRERSALVGTG